MTSYHAEGQWRTKQTQVKLLNFNGVFTFPNSDSHVDTDSCTELMACSHCTGTGAVQEQGTVTGPMGSNILWRNVHTGLRHGQGTGPIVFCCQSSIPCSGCVRIVGDKLSVNIWYAASRLQIHWVPLMAHFHCRTRIQIRTRIPNPMAT